jgi:uncharacterized protein YcfJ
MRSTLLAISMIATGLLSTHAVAYESRTSIFNDRADVIQAEPITSQLARPTRQCRTEYVEREVQMRGSERNMGGSILGGIAGAILGTQVGGGNGRIAATAIGAVAGSMVGDNLSDHSEAGGGRMRTERTPVERCTESSELETRITGYRVTYIYQGREFVTTTTRDPGRRIDIEVSLTPK